MSCRVAVSEEEYHELCSENAGICVDCGEINFEFHEPDAEEYPCCHCGHKSSMGIESALVCGQIDIL